MEVLFQKSHAIRDFGCCPHKEIFFYFSHSKNRMRSIKYTEKLHLADADWKHITTANKCSRCENLIVKIFLRGVEIFRNKKSKKNVTEKSIRPMHQDQRIVMCMNRSKYGTYVFRSFFNPHPACRQNLENFALQCSKLEQLFLFFNVPNEYMEWGSETSN